MLYILLVLVLTEIVENALRYIAQLEHREVIYTPFKKILQYFKLYNVKLGFAYSLLGFLSNEYQKIKADGKNKKLQREVSDVLMDM